MEEFAADTLLFDFYSELLNDHTKEVFEAYLNEDLSLSELAERFGMTRQGASDLIRRTKKSLRDFELKLGLEKRFKRIGEEIDRIKTIAGGMKNTEGRLIEEAADRIMGEL
ncbi:MAG: helix-turn-helix domain-containing protein [Lachnospiraceae bacterium]|nr:helix-turn-helix domain-containing protein [Lachnospiraceae bacterium]